VEAMRKVNHYWTTKQLERFQELYREHSLTVCRDKLNEEFQLNLSINQLKAATSNHNIRSGRTGCFPKGSTPWNKGKRFDCPGSRATRFKKGNRPQTYLPVGSEVVRTDGYLAVKVADPNKWRLKHRLIWEETHGPIPRGYVLLFLNQDKTDVRLENLVLIKRSRLAVANRYGLLSQSAELTKSGLLVAEVKHKAHNLKQKSKGILTHENH
jgi:hypothetical protein